MDPRTNGHGDEDRLEPEPERPRAPRESRPLRSSHAESLRAADQLARLEARIRDFHRNLESLDAAEANVSGLSRRTAEAHAAADSLVSRAAAAARLAVAAGEPVRDDAAASERADRRRRRSDPGAGEPSAAQRRIDALRPDAQVPIGDASPAQPDRGPKPPVPPQLPDPAVAADRIRQDAEDRAQQLLRDAARDAAGIRQEAEQEMQLLWEALEAEVETIQTEISQRVDRLAGRMETVSWDAEQIRAEALADAERIRQDATGEAEALLAVAEREAHALLAEARSQADALIAREPLAHHASAAATERSAAERLAEQIREATAALTRRVIRVGEDVASTAREIRGPASVPGSIREVLDGLGAAVALIERSLSGLAELLGDTLGSDGSDER